jgi:hypothetical protein
MTLDEILKEVRRLCDEARVSYIIIAGEKQIVSGRHITQLASNSSMEGVRGVVSSVVRLRPEGVALLAKALEDVARASVGVQQIDNIAAAGTFSEAAKNVVAALQPHFTLVGWEKPEAEEQKPTN